MALLKDFFPEVNGLILAAQFPKSPSRLELDFFFKGYIGGLVQDPFPMDNGLLIGFGLKQGLSQKVIGFIRLGTGGVKKQVSFKFSNGPEIIIVLQEMAGKGKLGDVERAQTAH